MSLPLDGVVVVSAEQALAAPFASRHMADLGATVIKIERPDGGDFARRYDRTVNGLASAFVWLNRSKKSITLDLAHPQAASVLDPLLERADVFIHNLKPDSVPRLHLSADELRARHPSLITCAISGYGEAGGRYADKKAYDLMIQAEVGLLSITGTEDAPAKTGISVADMAAGSYAFSSVLAALLERERTGVARSVSISLLDSLAEWMGHPSYYTLYGGTAPARAGTSHAIIAPYGPFRVGDGTVMLAVQNQFEWRRFCVDVLGRPDLVDDARFADNADRVAHRAELTGLIEAELADHAGDHVLKLLDAAMIANARLNTIAGFAEEYRANAPQRWRTVETSAGTVDALVPPMLAPAETRPFGRVPDLGEDTDEVLKWLGKTSAEVDILRAQGVLGVAT